MGLLTEALYESFAIKEGTTFADKVAETARDSVENYPEKPVEESLTESTIWDKVERNLSENLNEEDEDPFEDKSSKTEWDKISSALDESVWDEIKPYIQESLTEDIDAETAIDQYEALLRKDVAPAEAKARVLGREEANESLNESKITEEIPTARKKYDPKSYMKKVCERYRKEAGIGIDEKLTEEKLKYENWRIQNVAMKSAVNSKDLKEALIDE